MQTTLRISDETYRKVKAKSSELGLSITRFFEEAVRERLEKLEQRSSKKIELPVSSCSDSPMSESALKNRIEAADLENDISKLK